MSHYVDPAARRDAILDAVATAGTPVYLCDPRIVADRYRELDAALAGHWSGHVVGYSFKTNYEIACSPALRGLGAWAEVVSTRELDMALAAGYPMPEVIFNGPWKSDDGLRRALAGGALVNVNDPTELERMAALAHETGSRFAIGMRLSTDLGPHGRSRFGFSIDEDEEAARAVQRIERTPGLELVALHVHVYGDTDDPAVYAAAAGELSDFARRCVPGGGASLRYVDVGGGFPAHSTRPKSRTSWRPEPIAAYVESIVDVLGPGLARGAGRPRLVVEPGRYLADDAMVMVSTVVHTAERAGRRLVNTDASMSMVPLTHYRPQTIRGYSPDLAERADDVAHTVVYGATCRENDILHDGPFPALRVGDRLVHFGVGAYNANLSPSFILDTPPTLFL